jgi:uncharacterized protein (TIGR02594 family)
MAEPNACHVPETPTDFSAFPWMEIAYGEMGTSEIVGPQHNPRVIEYLSTCGNFTADETAWCSGFANWVMKQAGFGRTKSAAARSWLTWGDTLSQDDPAFGCISVFKRDGGGHVGFYVGSEMGELIILGGNQNNSVCLSLYPRSRLLGFRWPKLFPRP